MIKLRKKPVVVEGEQWFKVDKDKVRGNYHLNVGYFRRPDIPGTNICKHCSKTMHEHGWIDTLEGGHIVCPNDWIIKGVKGEFYPIKQDILKLTYDEVCESCNEVKELGDYNGKRYCNHCVNAEEQG